MRYEEDYSLQLQAKEYLAAIGKEAGEAILREYQTRYSHRPIDNEFLEETLVEICRQNESTLEEVISLVIASGDWNWLRENLEDVLYGVGEKAVGRLLREAENRAGGIPLVEGTLRKMGKLAVGPLCEAAREGVKYPGRVKGILREIQEGPVDFEIKDNPSPTPAILEHAEAAALRAALSSCSPEDLDLLRLKIRSARERSADAVDVSSFLPEFTRMIKVDRLGEMVEKVVADLREKETRKEEGQET